MAPTVSPYKLRDDTWGIQVVPPQEYDEGEIVIVETKKNGAYRAIVKRKIWGNDDKELYAVARMPDAKPGNCPMCGQRIPGSEREPVTAPPPGENRRIQSSMPQSNGASHEELDDDIPF